VVIRGAIANFSCPIGADELSGLACEAEFQPRLVRKGETSADWEMEQGPFTEDQLRSLPSTGGSW